MRRVSAAILILAVASTAYATLQWPPVPDEARLVFLYEHAGAPPPPKPGWLGKVLRFLVGLGPFERARRSRRLATPTGIFARDGVVLVADPGNHRVFRLKEETGEIDWLPKGRSVNLVSPVAAVQASDGRIFIADSAMRKVFILDPDGRPTGEFRGDPRGIGRPAGLALGEDRVFVSDVKNHRISVYGLDGIHLYSFGRRGEALGEFNFPTYLWYDARSQQLWVCDSGNFRVQWLDPRGTPLGRFGRSGDRPGFLARPRGIARDSDGNVYLVDGAFEAMQVFNENGRLLLFVGRSGSSSGQFSLPGGVFTDKDDRVFVADSFNGRIQVFQYLKTEEKRQ